MIALAGSLTHFRPLDVLRMLQMTSATGLLRVTHGAEQTDLYVESGRRLRAQTNGISLRVGDILVHRGLHPEAVALTAALQEDMPGRLLGEMLVESGVVDSHEVDEAVLEVQRRILCRVLLWQEGVFQFLPGEAPSNRGHLMIDLDVDEAIAGAMRSVAAMDADMDQKPAA